MSHRTSVSMFRLMKGGYAQAANVIVIASFLIASAFPFLPFIARAQTTEETPAQEEESVEPEDQDVPEENIADEEEIQAPEDTPAEENTDTPSDEGLDDGREDEGAVLPDTEEGAPEEESEGEDNEALLITPQFHTTHATIVARKVVCDSEEDLPNWGGGGPDVDSTTAEEWVEEHPNCHLEDDWSFEWKTEGDQSNPGGSTVGPAGGDWHTFIADGEMAIVNLDVEGVDLIQTREVLPEGYLPFTDSGDDVSAEFYCASDVAGYDNWEWIQNPEAGITYHCVGFNVPTETEKDTFNLHAQKIMCDDEADLPNWGAGAASIDAETAATWLADNEGNGCELVPWTFQWVDNEVSSTNPGDQTGVAGDGWSDPFSDSAIISAEGVDRVWIREVASDDHIPFTGQNTDQDVSAEMYCGTDVLHYDNWEFIDIPEGDHDSDYYCVAWNVPEDDGENEACRLEVVSEAGDEGMGNGDAVLAWIHSAWTTALNSVASWIWDSYQVADPGVDESKTFTKDFFVDTEVNDVTLKLAADNRYDIIINGSSVASSSGEFNYGSVTEVSLATSTINQGVNTITMEVENIGIEGSTPESNPAAGIYQLLINGDLDEVCEQQGDDDDDDDGSITIIKQVEGTTTADTFDFDASWLDQDIDFSLSAGASTTFDGVATGTYQVSEVFGTSTPWTLGSVICNDNNSTTTIPNGIEINVESDEDVTCTFVNELSGTTTPPATGTLVVEKIIVNDDGGTATTSDFTLQVIGNDATTTVTSGVATAFATGTYAVIESGTSTEDYTASFSGDCDVNGQVTVAADATSTCTLTNNDNQEPATTTSVAGMKWNDIDNDGIHDEGEPGIEGVVISISNDATTTPFAATTTTDVNGDYSFGSLDPDTYFICETVPAGFTQTYPATGTAPFTDCQGSFGHMITTDLATSSDVTGLDFGNFSANQCSVIVVSDVQTTVDEQGGSAADLVSFIHPAWTAAIAGASWIWGDDPVADPAATTTYTFTRQFVWNGPVTGATLEIASDNSYEVSLNSNGVGTSTDGNNFQVGTQDSFDVSALVVTGTNTLSFTVTNFALEGATDPESNPAGLLYRVSATSSNPDCAEPPSDEGGGGGGGGGGNSILSDDEEEGNRSGGRRRGGGSVLGASTSNDPDEDEIGEVLGSFFPGFPNTGEGGTAARTLGYVLMIGMLIAITTAAIQVFRRQT